LRWQLEWKISKVRNEGESRDLDDGEHPDEEEYEEHIVMVGVLPEPCLDLDEIILRGGIAGGWRQRTAAVSGTSGLGSAAAPASNSSSCCCCIIGG
jgi:hypothetical protein